jgi:MFS transporter, FSR family, fosmidomycin resistance protein
MTAPISSFSVKKSLFLLWISHLLMDFFTGVWPIYKTIANIDVVQAGMIAGISGFCGEILQIFFGYLCDRGHRKKVLLLGLTLSSAIIWVTFTENIFQSFWLLLLMMLGSGSFHPAAAGLAGSLTSTQKGRFILLFASGGAIGLGISQLTFTSLLPFFNGHAYVLVIPVVLVLIGISLHSFPYQTARTEPFSLKNFFAPLLPQKRSLVLLYLSQVFAQGLVLAFMFLLPDLLHARGCHSWLCFGGGHLAFVLGSSLTMVPAGNLSDKYGQKHVLIFTLLGATLTFYLFLMTPLLSVMGTILLLSSLGAFLGIINPLIVSWGNCLVPQSPSTVSALLMGFAWCLSNLGPTCAGCLTPLFSQNAFVYTIGFMGLSLLAVMLFVFLLPSPIASKAKENA